MKDKAFVSRIAFSILFASFLAVYTLKNDSKQTDGLQGYDGIYDATFDFFRPMNEWIGNNLAYRDALMIVNSFLIDIMVLYTFYMMYTGENKSVAVFIAVILTSTGKTVVQNISSLGRLPGFLYFYPGAYSMTVAYHDVNDFYYSGHTSMTFDVAYFLLAIKLMRSQQEKKYTWLFWTWTIGMGAYVYFMITVLFTHYIIDVTSALGIAFVFCCLSEKLSYAIDVKVFGFRW